MPAGATVGLCPDLLFRVDTPIPQLLGIFLLSASENHFPQGFTPSSMVQPEESNKLIREYKYPYFNLGQLWRALPIPESLVAWAEAFVVTITLQLLWWSAFLRTHPVFFTSPFAYVPRAFLSKPSACNSPSWILFPGQPISKTVLISASIKLRRGGTVLTNVD